MTASTTITPARPADRLLQEVVGSIVDLGIEVALVRDPGRDGHGRLEADLLVAPSDLDATERLLADRGFRRRPGWGRTPHRFHVRPVAHEASDTLDWLKIDLVTDLCFGRWHELASGTATACLRDRTPDARRGARLAPADELAALLLHGLLDRDRLRPDQQARLAELAPAAGHRGPLGARCAPNGSSTPTWEGIVGAIERGAWEDLESARPILRRRLRRGRHLAAVARQGRNRLARRGAKALTALFGRGPLVAFVGPDGTGKTTLATALSTSAGVPGRVLYGGTYRSGTTRSSIPGLTTARIARRLVGTRVRIAWHRSRGRLVILDRHPVQVRPGPADGLTGRSRARRRMLAATLPPPDLLVALDAPATVLHERRPEHSVDHLERDRQRHLALVDRVPGAEILDATHPPARVLDEAILLVWERAMGPDAHRATGAPR